MNPSIDVAYLKTLLKRTDLVNANVSPEVHAFLVELAIKIQMAFIKAAGMGIQHVSLIPNGMMLDVCAGVYCLQSLPNVIDVIGNRYHRVLLDELVKSKVKGVHSIHWGTDLWLGWFYT